MTICVPLETQCKEFITTKHKLSYWSQLIQEALHYWKKLASQRSVLCWAITNDLLSPDQSMRVISSEKWLSCHINFFSPVLNRPQMNVHSIAPRTTFIVYKHTLFFFPKQMKALSKMLLWRKGLNTSGMRTCFMFNHAWSAALTVSVIKYSYAWLHFPVCQTVFHHSSLRTPASDTAAVSLLEAWENLPACPSLSVRMSCIDNWLIRRSRSPVLLGLLSANTSLWFASANTEKNPPLTWLELGTTLFWA